MATKHFLLLTQISSALSQWDLKNLIFCCGDVLFEAAAEKIESGIDLFRTLKHHNKLEPGRYEYLRECLRAIGRMDLAKKLPSPIETMIYQVPSHERSLIFAEGSDQADHNDPSRSATSTDHPPMEVESFSFRALLLKVAKELTSDDVSRLAYLFNDQLSLDKPKANDATVLLQQLEKVGAINPRKPTSLVSSLHEIGRKDMAGLLVSLLTPQSLLSSLDHPHQLLGIKISMLKNKRGCYTFQRNFIATVAKCDRSTYENYFVAPLMKNGIIFYDDHTIRCHSTDLYAFVRESGKLDQLLQSTLPDVYDFNETYFKAMYHYVSRDCVEVSKLQSFLSVCHGCYKRFDEEISSVPWNMTLRKDVEKEFTQRRTPLGTPALKAIKCIYEVCNELYGGSDIEEAMKDMDNKLYVLEYSHYSWCCRRLMIQWLESILCLLVDKEDSLRGTNYNPLLLQEVLLKIVSKYQDEISSIYIKVSNIIGKEVAERLSVKLHCEGISINNDIGPGSVLWPSGNDSNAYVKRLSVPIYTYLLLLLHFSYFGSCNLKLSEIFPRLRELHLITVSDKLSVTCLIRVVRNVMSAYEAQVDVFREKAMELNASCAPVIDYIVSSQ